MPVSSVFMNTPTHTMPSTTHRLSQDSSAAAASAASLLDILTRPAIVTMMRT